MIAYFVLELCKASAWVALGGSIAVIVARLAWLITRHGLTRISMLSMATFIATAALVTITGNRWLFLLKPVIAELTIGITVLVTDRRRPQSYSLPLLCRLQPRRAEELRQQYDRDPEARRRHRTVTTAWAIVAIIEGLLRGTALLVLPTRVAMGASLPLMAVSLVLGTVRSLRYLSLPRRDGVHRATETAVPAAD
jgi:hypothetical protein